MLDKNTLTNHIKDIELKNKIYKVIDKSIGVLKNYDYRYSEFLNPYELKNAIAALNAIDNISYSVYGGYEKAERKLIYIYPFYVNKEDINKPIKAIKISGNFKFRKVSHRDYLGSLLGLGIKREKIGDILIHENFCQVIVCEDICDYIVLNLEKVGNNTISLEEIDLDNLIYSEPEYKEVNFTAASSRLDTIISGIYNISRQESSNYINSEKVFVDYEKITSASKSIKENCIISVRGQGRAIVSQIGDYTKKGRLKVKAKIII
jgi:RNA-binding protein YlmH